MSSVSKGLSAAVFLAACLSAPAALAQASLDVTVSPEKTDVVVLSGSAQLCDPTETDCEVVSAGCGAASVSGQGVDVVDESARPGYIAANFPFVTNPESLESDFRVDATGCFRIPNPLYDLNPPRAPGSPN